ncbi:1,6-anhydro-N-acetylmuramyl-L-alanine amidase AmpD [Methylococcus sp. EFPC2]|uniref:1,6-anhydro-N-acetylmuramyl-L-alanine amidase AmpD n=1 Tax=Methylococcus sp. EFPC2 TaxID=2812648 RepID=UPI0019674348|nr:1,6-anhydro-N-acetylmuramyl-L-alanine amidase AmpD [Methylococcus sp. EFPC2]QSA96251.1 1,6-anhydro-N-acetylmuramyl-L-alanine amidase AmpD [Methylococcus sp. EFPC2]
MKIEQGWLDSARRCPSPHCDDRSDPAGLALIVVHCISLPPGEFGGDWIDRLFLGTLPADAHPYFAAIHQLRVSAHLLIRRDGEIVQYVPFDRRAWHAGVSVYRGRECCNDFSIGIELEGDEQTAYADVQYRRLAEVIAGLLAHYPTLSRADIAGHSDIAPGRKTDPGDSFDWACLNGLLDAQPMPR